MSLHPALLLLAPTLLASVPAFAHDFRDDYRAAAWSTSGITGGTAAMDLTGSSSDLAIADYNVNLGSGGVSHRTTTFTVRARADGWVSFDWEYALHHRWYLADAELTFFAYDENNQRNDTVVFDASTRGAELHAGTITYLEVFEGQRWGFEVGGSNFDSNAIVSGTVVLSGLFTFEDDCGGFWGAYDECGVCDDDPSNDCVEDCAGDLGGLAQEDMCGVCDEDPSNDCVQDCAGDWGGSAMEDMCGSCDEDPSNDCTQDCAGDWGGAAMEDMCGTCDEDPSNDCVQDCAGDWGGAAMEDMCGTCDEDASNDCVQDCAGEWGGSATAEDCDDDIVIEEEPCDPETGHGCSTRGGGAGMLGLFAGLMLLGRRRSA